MLERLQEFVGYTMLLVEINGALSSLITDNLKERVSNGLFLQRVTRIYVAMGQVLCNNATTWLFLLSDLICIALRFGSVVVSLLCAHAGSTAHFDLGSTKLGVVEQEGCLRGCLLFENDSGILRVTLWGDLDTGDLATEELLAVPKHGCLRGRITRKRRSP